MLSKHDRKSRTRITAGVTGAAALTLAGLALTASGTQAAANLRADVGEAIGVDLAQDAPAAPDAPAPLEAPDAPDAIEAPDAPDVPKAAKVERRVVIVEKGKDGKKRVVEVPENGKPFVWTDNKSFVWKGDMDELARIPAISSADCGPPKDGDVKIEKNKTDKRTIVICTDRIEARAEAARARADAAREIAMESRAVAGLRVEAAREIARESRAIAVASADMGMRHALAGLKLARKSIEMQRDMTDAERSAALKGIDEAIREVQSAGKD